MALTTTSSHLRSFLRLNRLTLAVVLLYVWLVAEGTQALIQGRASHVDRSNRRDLSLFRLGLELVLQALTWLEPFHAHWSVSFDPFPFSFLPESTVGLARNLLPFWFYIPIPDFIPGFIPPRRYST